MGGVISQVYLGVVCVCSRVPGGSIIICRDWFWFTGEAAEANSLAITVASVSTIINEPNIQPYE